MNILSTISDVAVITSSLIVGWVAIKGLSIWKKEHVGKQGYTIARNLLKAVYETHSAIQDFRDPFMNIHEQPVSIPEEFKESGAIKYYEKRFMYNHRAKAVSDNFNNLRKHYFESLVEWGTQKEKLYSEYLEFMGGLVREMEGHLYNERTGEEVNQINRELLFENHPDTNKYTKKLNQMIVEFENWLRPLMMNQKTK